MKRRALGYEIMAYLVMLIIVGAAYIVLNAVIAPAKSISQGEFPNAADPSTASWMTSFWQGALLFVVIGGGIWVIIHARAHRQVTT